MSLIVKYFALQSQQLKAGADPKGPPRPLYCTDMTRFPFAVIVRKPGIETEIVVDWPDPSGRKATPP